MAAKGNAYCIATCGSNGPTLATTQQPAAYRQNYSDYVTQAGQSNVHQYAQNGYLVSCSTNYIGFYSCRQGDGSRVPINAQVLSQLQNNCVGQSITSDCFSQQNLRYTSTLASGDCTYQCMEKQQYYEQYGFAYGQATQDYINCTTGLSYQKVCQYSDQSIVLTSSSNGCSPEACQPRTQNVIETACTDQCFINVRTGQSLLNNNQQSSVASQCCKTVQQGQLAPAPEPEQLLQERQEELGPISEIPFISLFPNNIGPDLFTPNPEYSPYVNPSDEQQQTPSELLSPRYYVNQRGDTPTQMYIPSSEISPDSFRTNPFGEPIFTNSPELLEVPEPGFLMPLEGPLEDSTSRQNRSQYLGSPNISIPASYQPLCTDRQVSNYGCNLNLVEVPIQQSNYSVWLGSWEPCSAACDGGVSFRSINCIDALYKFPVNASSCGTQLDYYGFDVACNTQPCQGTHWVVGNFSDCVDRNNGQPQLCGGGLRRREASCVTANATVIAQCVGVEECQQTANDSTECPSPPIDLLEIECNTTPCSDSVFTYRIESWGTCNGNCSTNNGIGTQDRQISCVDIYNNKVDNQQCIQPPPKTSQNCSLECIEPQGAPTQERRQLLEAGWEFESIDVEGTQHRQLLQQSPQQQQIIYDGQGNICRSGQLDMCGVCGGNCKTFDLAGRPCDLTLDQLGTCCESGDIIQGVCKGNAQQLNTTSTGVCTAAKENTTDCPILPETKCPLGTSANNPNETLALCSNRGRCSYLTSICDCFSGYYGDSCDRCAPYYRYNSQTNACVPENQNDQDNQSPHAAPQDSQAAPPFKSHFNSTSQFRGVVVAIAIGVALFLACLWILIFALILLIRRRKMQKKYNNKVKAFANMMDNKAQPRTYSGVWQSFTEKLAGPMENVNINGSSHSQQDLLASGTTPSPSPASPFVNRGQEQQTGSGNGQNNEIQNLLNGNQGNNANNHLNISGNR